MARMKIVLCVSLLFFLGWGSAGADELRLSGKVHIDSFSQSRLTIGGKVIRTDVVIFPNGLVVEQGTAVRHVLNVDDVKNILDVAPDILVIGLGCQGRMRPTGKFLKEMERMGVEVVMLPTPDAVRKLQELRAADKDVAAFFHTGC